MPKPGTAEMVQMLHSVIAEAVSGVDERFTTGDLMGACLYHLIEAASICQPDPELMMADINDVMKKIVADRRSAEGTTRQ